MTTILLFHNIESNAKWPEFSDINIKIVEESRKIRE